MEIHAIAATGARGQLGLEGSIPFSDPRDRAWFREATLGYPVIMGSRTLDSIGHALDGRDNLILSRSEAPAEHPGLRFFSSLEQALQEVQSAPRCYIIGGCSLYGQTRQLWDHLWLSVFSYDGAADCYFPEFLYRQPEILESRDYPPLDSRHPGFHLVHYLFP